VPFYRCEITSPLPPKTVEARLRQAVRRGNSLSWWQKWIDPPPDLPPFEGDVYDGGFAMRRIIRYKNAYLPALRGTIDETIDGGTIVRVRMTISPFAALFIVFWITIVSFISWPVLRELRWNEMTAVPVIMLVAGLLLPTVSFYAEAWLARRLIREALAKPLDS
jgi:hypothetical protein